MGDRKIAAAAAEYVASIEGEYFGKNLFSLKISGVSSPVAVTDNLPRR